MIDLLNQCFLNAKLKVFNEIDFTDNVTELNSLDSELFRNVLIYEFINKMSSFTGHDFLPDYLDYMKSCNDKWIERFNQHVESM